MNLLLVEDKSSLAGSLSHLLKLNDFVVDAVLDGATGMKLACSGCYDIIVLNFPLPEQDSIAFLRAFRSLGYETPVVILTAQDLPEDRGVGFPTAVNTSLVTAAGLTLDPLSGQVVKGAETFHLTAKESSLLELLMRNYSQVVTKTQISDKIWGSHSKTVLANVDLYIHYLRKKLNVHGIRTIRGIGYSLQEDNHVS